MAELVRFSFPLSARMHAFVELRDGLIALESARQSNQPYAWLQAAADVRASLHGEYGRKQAQPELIALLASMRNYLNGLAEAHPKFQRQLMESCDALLGHTEMLRQGLRGALDFLIEDGLINCYINAVQKQDFLAHRPLLAQTLGEFWRTSTHRDALSERLHELYSAVLHLDAMLNDFVRWQERRAEGGLDQITPERGSDCGMLIVGLDGDTVRRGIVPEFSGNRLAVRLRFLQYLPGESAKDVIEDQVYSLMKVPIS